MAPNRRTFLASTAAIAGPTLAGCLASGSGGAISCADEQIAAEPPTVGPDSAPTLELFLDYGCPHCKDYHETHIPPLLEAARNGRLQVIHHDYPLPADSLSRPASQLGRAVTHRSGTNAFYAYSDTVFDQQDALSMQVLRDAAVQAGLEAETVQSQVENNQFCQAVIDSESYGEGIGVEGTPYMQFQGRVSIAAPASKILGRPN